MKLPDLTGKTVAVVGAAPGATVPPADYVIAASGGLRIAPNADMLVMIDGKMWDGYHTAFDDSFAGLRVVGVPTDRVPALYIPFQYETANGKQFRNNGISAVRLAAQCGAKRILLSGFDWEAYDAANAHVGYAGLTASAVTALIAELAAQGVAVEYCVPPVKPKVAKSWTSEI